MSLSNVKGNFDWNNHELVEFKILGRMKEISRVYSLYFRGAAFSSFREQVYRIM